jgi:hypothetical protein
MQANRKNLLIAVLALLAIIGAGLSIYSYLRKPEDKINIAIHEAVGEALAEEVIKSLKSEGKIVLVTLEKGQSHELDEHLRAFKDRIYDTPVKIAGTDHVSSDKSPKFGPGAGMSGKRFLRVMQKYPNIDAVVSFVGTPDGDDAELKYLKPPLPKFFAFSRAPHDIDELVKDELLTAAIVPRFQFPAPGPEKPKTKQDWFTRHYQIVRAGSPMPGK